MDSKHSGYDLLVKQYQDGNKGALKALVKRFHPNLCQTIQYYTKDQEPVDDIAQECWYAIIEQLDEINIKISFGVWARTIARRKAIDWIRRQQRSRKYSQKLKAEDQSKAEAQNEIHKEEKLQKVLDGIQQLPAPQRIVLEMFYRDNLSLKEISSVLNISAGTVKSRLFYAREKLKELISQPKGGML